MKVKVITLYEEKIRIKDDEQPYNDIYYYVSLRRTDDFALILAVLQMERERWNEKKSRWETVKIAREITDLFDDDPGDGVLVRRAIARFDEFIKEHEEQS